jgi:hypothetical protein
LYVVSAAGAVVVLLSLVLEVYPTVIYGRLPAAVLENMQGLFLS